MSNSANTRFTGRLTRENTALLIIDHQVGLYAGVRDITLQDLKHNVVGLVKSQAQQGRSNGSARRSSAARNGASTRRTAAKRTTRKAASARKPAAKRRTTRARTRRA